MKEDSKAVAPVVIEVPMPFCHPARPSVVLVFIRLEGLGQIEPDEEVSEGDMMGMTD